MRSLVLLFLLGILSLGSSAQKAKAPKHDFVVTISTEFGDLKILLYDKTPLHKQNFLKLTKEGFYNGTAFHRIIDGFMIQGGDPNSKDSDPNNDGMGGPGYTVPNELAAGYKHVRGAVAAARMGDQVNPERASSGSQFYLVENHEGTPFLDNSYTVFGQVVAGIDIIDTIAAQPKDFRDRPVKEIKMTVKAEKMKRKKIIKLFNCQNFYNS